VTGKYKLDTRILLVDNKAEEVRELKSQIGSITHGTIRVVDSITEALKMASSWIPDLIISEWLVGDQDAANLLQALKNKPSIAGIPVIVCTATHTQEIKLRAKRLGVFDFLLKPVNRYALKWQLDLLFAELPTPVITRKEVVRREFEILAEQLDDETAISRVKIKRIQELAPMPEITGRVLEISRNPHAGARDFAEVIRQDQALTARILKTVNSAFYGFDREIGNIERAIVILGVEEVVQVTQAACLIQASLRWSDNPNFDHRQFWTHSLGAAYIARALARKLAGLDSKDAFVMGLMHDFGKVVMDQYFREIFNHLIEVSRLRRVPLYKIEKEIIDIEHAEIGCIVADAWRLPDKLVRAISLHHRPAMAAETDHEVHLAHVANSLCHMKNIGSSGNWAPEEPQTRSLNALGLERRDLVKIWESLRINIDSIELLV